MLKKVVGIIGTLSLFCFVTSVFGDQITGAGSSFVYPLVARWANGYSKQAGFDINYQSIGSSGGEERLVQRVVDFSAVDMPLTSKVLKERHWLQFPIAMGGIVVVANLPSNTLRLDGDALAKIFMGKITRWNDPQLQKLNPNSRLPNMPIVVVHRADGSGTTYNFTQYLSQVSPLWKEEVGVNTMIDWPAGVGGKGNSGVALFIQHIPGSISYIESSYAKIAKLPTVALKNKAGQFVLPTENTFNAATKYAQWRANNNFHLTLINQPGKQSWPIVTTSFVLLPNNQKNRTAILDFLSWSYQHGRTEALKLDYIPLPEKLVIKIKRYWKDHDTKETL